MNILDNGTRSALLQALRTPSLPLDALDTPESAPTAAAQSLAQSGDSALAGDPAEALLALDVWQGRDSRALPADAALPSLQGSDAADRLAAHVLVALG